MHFEIAYPRTIPERRPQGFKPPVQRYHLRWEEPVHTIVTDYFGLQSDRRDWAAEKAFIDRVRDSFRGQDAPGAHEVLRSVSADGVNDTIIVAYWLDATSHGRWSQTSALAEWLASPARVDEPFGYWRESMT